MTWIRTCIPNRVSRLIFFSLSFFPYSLREFLFFLSVFFSLFFLFQFFLSLSFLSVFSSLFFLYLHSFSFLHLFFSYICEVEKEDWFKRQSSSTYFLTSLLLLLSSFSQLCFPFKSFQEKRRML